MFTELRLRKRQIGVTLLEMMATLAIAAVLIIVVAPRVQSNVNLNRIVASLNDTSSALQFARYTAVTQKTNTVVCPSENGQTCQLDNWNLPKIVFIDHNDNGVREKGEALLFTTDKLEGPNTMSGPSRAIRFDASGNTTVAAKVLICPDNDDAMLARALSVTTQGKVRLSKDDNKDGIHENTYGNNLSCL